MELLEKILLGVDFTQTSKDALLMTIHLAETFHSEIILIHVIPEIDNSPAFKRNKKKMAAEKLKQIRVDLNNKGTSSVETIIRSGIPFERIIERSEELDVNLIVLGSGEEKRGFPLGMTAERVMTYANKPVFVVKRGSIHNIESILCPVDFSEPSRRALNDAIHLSRLFHAHLNVVMVFRPLLSSYFGPGKTPGESKEKFLVERQEAELDRFLRGFDLGEVRWSKIIKRGEPHREILASIHRMKSDLLIVGSRGRTGLSRMFLGSTTERVVREMPCSVIVLKQEHAIRSDLTTEMNDIEKHFRRGKQRLEEERFEEALHHFEYCTRRNSLFAPGWEGMSSAHKRLGQKKEAKRYKEMADYIRHLLDERISSEPL